MKIRRSIQLLLIFFVQPTFTLICQNSWNQTSFIVGGFCIGDSSDNNRYTQINNADIDILINADKPWLSGAQTVASRLQTLNQTVQGFDMKGVLLYAADPAGIPYKVSFNTDAFANDASIANRLLIGGIYNSYVEGWYVWDEP